MNNDKSRGVIRRIFKKSDNKIKMELINSIDYIEWLIMFTERNPAWRDDMIEYEILSISSKNDKQNMSKLKLFFEVIHNYAVSNGIKYYCYDKEIYYFLKINNYGLQIGKINNSEILYYCQKKVITNEEFIDFGDIKFKNSNELLMDYNEDLKRLEEVILELYQKKVPIFTIEETTKKLIKKIKNNYPGGRNDDKRGI